MKEDEKLYLGRDIIDGRGRLAIIRHRSTRELILLCSILIILDKVQQQNHLLLIPYKDKCRASTRERLSCCSASRHIHHSLPWESGTGRYCIVGTLSSLGRDDHKGNGPHAKPYHKPNLRYQGLDSMQVALACASSSPGHDLHSVDSQLHQRRKFNKQGLIHAQNFR